MNTRCRPFSEEITPILLSFMSKASCQNNVVLLTQTDHADLIQKSTSSKPTTTSPFYYLFRVIAQVPRDILSKTSRYRSRSTQRMSVTPIQVYKFPHVIATSVFPSTHLSILGYPTEFITQILPGRLYKTRPSVGFTLRSKIVTCRQAHESDVVFDRCIYA